MPALLLQACRYRRGLTEGNDLEHTPDMTCDGAARIHFLGKAESQANSKDFRKNLKIGEYDREAMNTLQSEDCI